MGFFWAGATYFWKGLGSRGCERLSKRQADGRVSGWLSGGPGKRIRAWVFFKLGAGGRKKG